MERNLSSSQMLLFMERYNLARKSQGIALILCLLFGAFGAHKFYLNQKISGTIYLIFCWSLIPALLAIVDLFIISSQVKQHNNQLALNTLHNINPLANSELLQVYKQYEMKWLVIFSRIIATSAAILFVSQIYTAFVKNIDPSEITLNLGRRILSHYQIINPAAPTKFTHYYNLYYDNLILGMSLSQAQKFGYTDCNHNQYYIICSNPKLIYPNFLNYNVRFAIAQFNNNKRLSIIHLYLASAPKYNDIINAIATITHGTSAQINYLALAGSHETISINPKESSIQITDKIALLKYTKDIAKDQLLNSD